MTFSVSMLLNFHDNVARLFVHVKPMQPSLMFVGETCDQCYKTFFVRNFLISYKARVFVRNGWKILPETVAFYKKI